MFGSEKSESEIEQKLGLLDSLQLSCTACGICNESCATYQASGWEHESPRGRIRLSRDFLEGKIHPSSKALQTFDRCLGCRACEASCPISVQYQSIRGIVQHIRIVLNPDQKMSRSEQQWIKLAWRIGSRRWRTYGSRWLKDLLVSSGSYLYRYSKKEFFFLQPLKLVVSCIQDLCQHELIQQTIELLNKLGGGIGIKVKTEEALDKALRQALEQRGAFYIIEVELDKMDFSPGLTRLGQFLGRIVQE
jgi:glycolate oxidase iron-sulfur subunit